MKPGFLVRQFSIAKKSLAETAKYMPYVFEEYQRYLRAKDALDLAKKEFEEAKSEWDRITNG